MVFLWIYLVGVACVAGGLTWLLRRIDGDHLDRHTAVVIAAFALTWPGSVPLTAIANVFREASIVNRYWLALLVIMLVCVTVVTCFDFTYGNLEHAEKVASRGFGLVTIIAVALMFWRPAR